MIIIYHLFMIQVMLNSIPSSHHRQLTILKMKIRSAFHRKQLKYSPLENQVSFCLRK